MNSFRHDELSRRDFVTAAAFGFLGLSLPGNPAFAADAVQSPVSARAKPAKSIIYLWMGGGMSHLDTFDPKPDKPEQMGATRTITDKKTGLQFGHHLNRIAAHADILCPVRSLNTTQGAHEQGTYIMHSSYAMRGTVQHPHFGAWFTRLAGRLNPTLPPYVRVNGGRGLGAGWMGQEFAALPINDPAAGLQYSKRQADVPEDRFQDRLHLLDEMNKDFLARHPDDELVARMKSYEDAVRLMKSEDLKAFDIMSEDAKLRSSYGSHAFGKGCLLARRLVEKGTRFVEVSLGGWDMHNDIAEGMEKNGEILDQALGTLLTDLRSRGLLDSTLVVVASEFGRTPEISGRAGRDHYPKAFSCLLAGGGVKGGQAWGATDPQGREVVDKSMGVTDFNATLAYACGIDHTKVIVSGNGRPFQIADKGQPATGLFS
ncbi:MAG: hypothetical protein RL095_1571 [Verrucomicrobiota bacterium]|jgi:uncharacterized protein (DUF1501 family)